MSARGVQTVQGIEERTTHEGLDLEHPSLAPVPFGLAVQLRWPLRTTWQPWGWT
jgi:hypothetical protein